MYKLLKRWYISDGENPAETGWKHIGTFHRIRHARRAMHRDVRETEAANEYRSPHYGGKENTQKSIRI